MNDEAIKDLFDRHSAKYVSGRRFMMEDQFRAALTEYAPKWREVDKGFPERSKNVLLRRKKPFHVYELTGFQRDEIFYSNETGLMLEGVTHWAEINIPTPPQTEKE